MEFKDKVILQCFIEVKCAQGFYYRNLILGIECLRLIATNIKLWPNG